MDDLSYPLVPRAHANDHALVPVPTAVATLDEPPEFAFFASLRQRLFLLLVLLLLLAVRLIRALRREMLELRQQAHYWQNLHHRAKLREAKLHQQIQELQAQIRDLHKRFSGRKSETSAATMPTPASASSPAKPKRPRGQQRGASGPVRRSYDHLPTVPETCQVPADQQGCRACGAPWRILPGTDSGHILEIEVRAYRRVYRRQRYERT